MRPWRQVYRRGILTLRGSALGSRLRAGSGRIGAVKIATIQLTPTTDPRENLTQMRVRAAEAAATGARVMVFPEQTMVLLQSVTVDALSEVAAEWWEAFAALTSELAVEHDAVV